MCVICVKRKGVAFPEEQALKNCFENNPDGAGFMYSHQGKVHIVKGLMTYKDFDKALKSARRKAGDNAPFVMHFRIATQGYQDCMTHPFPLSSSMNNLKKLKCKCNIGIAHNGVLSLTSDGSKDYSDTMKFITDYLSLIIRSYTWAKDKRNVDLIERLIKGSRLAILDKNGVIETLGEGWVKEGDLLYSNSSYSYARVKYYTPSRSFYQGDDWWDDGYYLKPYQQEPKDEWDYYVGNDGQYDFNEYYCPMSEEDDDSYCSECSNFGRCPYIQAVLKDQAELADLENNKADIA